MASGISSAPSQMPTATGVWWAHCEIWFSSSVDRWAYTYVHFPISVGLKYYQLRHLTIEDRKGMKRQFNTIVIIYVTFLSLLIFIKTFISSIMTGDLKTVFTIPMSTELWEFSVKASAIPPALVQRYFPRITGMGPRALAAHASTRQGPGWKQIRRCCCFSWTSWYFFCALIHQQQPSKFVVLGVLTFWPIPIWLDSVATETPARLTAIPKWHRKIREEFWRILDCPEFVVYLPNPNRTPQMWRKTSGFGWILP